MTLERDDLERDLIRRDKQSLISDCLRLFDVNHELVLISEGQVKRIKDLQHENERLREDLKKQKARTWIQVLNNRIEQAINRRRNQRELKNRT